MTDKYRQELKELLEKDAPTLRPITLGNTIGVAILNYFLRFPDHKVSLGEMEKMFDYLDLPGNVSPTLSGLGAWQILDNEEGWFLSEPSRTFKIEINDLHEITHDTPRNKKWLAHLREYNRQPTGDRMDKIFELACLDAIARGYRYDDILRIIAISFAKEKEERAA